MSKWKMILFTRKHVFIEPRQQLKFCFDLLLHSLILPLMLMVFFTVEPFASWFVKGDAGKSRTIVLDFLRLCWENWPVLLLVMFVVGIISVLFSHKMIGPIYGCKMNMEKLRAGDKQVYFGVRNGDYFREFVRLLADYVAKKEGTASGDNAKGGTP